MIRGRYLQVSLAQATREPHRIPALFLDSGLLFHTHIHGYSPLIRLLYQALVHALILAKSRVSVVNFTVRRHPAGLLFEVE